MVDEIVGFPFGMWKFQLSLFRMVDIHGYHSHFKCLDILHDIQVSHCIYVVSLVYLTLKKQDV